MTAGVFICTDEPSGGVSLEGAVGIANLCQDPRQVIGLVGAHEQAVLALHRGRFDLSTVQTALRSAGVDPLGVQIAEMAAVGGTPPGWLDIQLRGAVARARSFPGSSPEHLKLSIASRMSRRAFLSPPAPEYMAAPFVNPSVCAAGDGCRVCVIDCPHEAYRWQRGRIHYNKDICQPCGQCVVACPTGAIGNPAVTSEALLAQVSALLDASDTAIGVAFVCSRGETEPTADWYTVAVPCTSMVPGSWLIAVLLLGAGSARSVPCKESGCRLAHDRKTAEALAFARGAAAWYGWDESRLPSFFGRIGTPGPRVALEDPFSVHGAVEVFTAMIESGGDLGVMSAPGADIGTVTIDPDACTMCSQCVQICPTDALLAGGEGGVITLTFDGRLCTSCGQCTLACPEIARGAISVQSQIDPSALAGRRTLNEGAVLRCEVCGAHIAPERMMSRISDVLGDEFATTAAFLGRRCLDCRGI